MGDVHRDLVIRACRWLEKTERCKHVFAEVQSLSLSEFPDAIGYNSRGGTVVVEAKASVSDFRRDAAKSWKAYAKTWTNGAPEQECRSSAPVGMGSWRFLDAHGLELRVDHCTVDPDYRYCVTFMRRYLNESPDDTRRIWVTSPHTSGQVRMYVLGDGVLRHTYPDYTGAWPELDTAVAARLGATLYADVTWLHNGPRENWRATS